MDTFEVGETVWWKGDKGRAWSRLAKILHRVKVDNQIVYLLDNERWCYGYQLERAYS
jgi:hypothetical protein